MGYSWTVVMKSRRHKEEMLEFLKKHLRHPPKLCRSTTPEIYGGTFGYDKGELKIGYNCSSTLEYMTSVLRWAAIKSGRRMKLKHFEDWKNSNPEEHSVPYLRYDGHTSYAVVPHGLVDPFVGCTFYDEIGYPAAPYFSSKLGILARYYVAKMTQMGIKTELLRLEAAWNAEHPT